MTDQGESPRSGGAESDARGRYRDGLARIEAEAERLRGLDARYGQVRVTLFFATLGLGLLGFYATEAVTAFRVAAAVSFVAFLAAVVLNEPVRDRRRAAVRRRAVLRRLQARLDRDWETLADRQLSLRLGDVRLEEGQRSVANDLDLFGQGSLFQFASMAATTPGIETLARWLAGPADPEAARGRAQAVRVLAGRREDRLRFYTLADDVGRGSGDPARFLEWAGGPPWLRDRPWLIAWANVSAALSVALLLMMATSVANLAPFSWRMPAWGLGAIAVANLVVAGAFLGPAHAIFAVAMSSRRAVDEYRELFAAGNWLDEPADTGQAFSEAGQKPSGTEILARIRSALLDPDGGAIAGMDRLARVARAGALRQSAATFLAYLPLQAFGLWDVRVLRWLEQWQARYGDRCGAWFAALGELEALMSLAAIPDEYPDWAFPEWQPASPSARLTATAIGHPLLADGARVTNDVSIGPPGTFLLITGSNMSGKSTMLRSVGLNVALAAAGAPVCAARFGLPGLQMATSIRVRDDLGQGVSFYMAELRRLKSVVDQAMAVRREEGGMLLFLLDEILQGTNSRERQIAVTQVLRTLLGAGAIGAITTHDLELADEPQLRDAAETVHFRETIERDPGGREQMTFDYRMRPGVSPTTNALRLLEMVGLGSAEPEGRPAATGKGRD